ncbi:MAG TPA: MFS transporter [Candidatus Methylomirabilis sp.]|nr:MFS transporter [Candidatus Methylomirabilis sp.]
MTTIKTNSEATIGPLAPLREPVYRALWIATVASNIGTWMQDVGAAWLMTALAPSPMMVALVRAASSFPMFLLALPAGALADVVDRRVLLIVTQSWMLAAAGVLGLLTLAGVTTPWLLLTLTFLLGLGTSLNAPAWQAIIPELVAREQVANAVSLNSISINLARSVGPAIGGLVIALAGTGWTFVLNAVSFCGVILALYRWRRPHRESVLPAERVWSAIRAGLRYVRHAPAVRAVLVRSGTFVLFGSALWALLPSLARFGLGRGPAGYGILLGFFGIGAVMGAALLSRWRAKFSINRVVRLAVALFVFSMLLLAWAQGPGVAEILLFLAGAAWLILLSTFNSSIQALVPAWVRGRALAVSILVFFGGMVLGSVLWGYVAELFGLQAALVMAAAGGMVTAVFTRRYRLHSGEGIDLTPSVHWPAPQATPELEPEQGPVVITVEYRIDPAAWHEFARAMQHVRRIRRRDGAMNWGLLRDVAEVGHYTEIFVVESWLDHLRQHERVTVADRDVLEQARAFHVDTVPPLVSHYIVEQRAVRK